MLDRPRLPRRPAGRRHRRLVPAPSTADRGLLDYWTAGLLYHGAGCSSSQIELLTGQPQIVVRDTMHRLGTALRPEHMSPALLRLRAAARQDFLAQVAAEYRSCGSTAEVAKLHDCASNTVLRWLAQAGVAVPGRGQSASSRDICRDRLDCR